MTILYFGALKEKIAQTSGKQNLFKTDYPIAVKTLRQSLSVHYKINDFLTSKTLCAVNQHLVSDDFIIKQNDEIAFFPPMTGG